MPKAGRPPVPVPPIPIVPVDEAPSLPGSESYNYAIPILHRPGRAGLDLDLTLYYNSRVWTVDSVGNTINFNADNDWPSYGFRLGWCPLEYDATNDQFLLTLPDGSKETLTNNGAGSYVTTDGTLMSFGPAAQFGGNILRLKDGTWLQYIVFPGSQTNRFRVQGITDPNGNYIYFTYRSDTWAQSAPHGQEIDTIYDTAGNQFTFNYDTNHKLSSIMQGSKTWATFTWGTTPLTYNFSGLTAPDTQDSGSTLNVLLACTYPDGTGYNFGYGGWGIVNSISRFNSGMSSVRSSVQYNYPAGTVAQTGHPTYTLQTVFDGVNTNTWGYAETKSSGVVTSLTVTDPTGAKMVTNLDPNTGLTSSVQWQNTSGSTLRTASYAWTTSNQIQSVTTTLNDTGQQSKVQYGYNSTGLLSDTWEYDYGLVLKRHTTLQYLTGTSYTNYHILNRVTQTMVKNGSDAIVARADLAYDQGSLTTTTGAAAHFDSSYPASFTTRGNLTTVTRYSNAAAGTGAISRTFTYDTTGNLLTAQLDCCNKKTWSYSVATYFVFPDSVRRGPDAGPQLTTSATYDIVNGLVLTATDENGQVTNFSYMIDPQTPDPMNRLRSVARSDGVHTISSSYSYDDTSALASVTVSNSANSLVQKTIVDGAGRTLESDVLNSSSLVSASKRTYDALGRTARACNPAADSNCSLYTSYSYDALSRVHIITPPSGGYSQFDYSGNSVTTTDPAGKQRRSYSDALGRLVEVDEPGWGDGLPGKGSVTITGSEQTGFIDPCLDEGMGSSCPQTVYDSGWVSITVNGVTDTTTYGRGSTAATVAGGLAGAINADPNSPVSAGVSGSTINLTAKQANASTNYSLSANSASTDPNGLFGASFGGTRSGPTLIGARDATVQASPSLVTPMMTTYTYDALDDLTAVSQAGLA